VASSDRDNLNYRAAAAAVRKNGGIVSVEGDIVCHVNYNNASGSGSPIGTERL
jgi:hypothetical protein